jgi:hypothetical protein
MSEAARLDPGATESRGWTLHPQEPRARSLDNRPRALSAAQRRQFLAWGVSPRLGRIVSMSQAPKGGRHRYMDRAVAGFPCRLLRRLNLAFGLVAIPGADAPGHAVPPLRGWVGTSMRYGPSLQSTHNRFLV